MLSCLSCWTALQRSRLVVQGEENAQLLVCSAIVHAIPGPSPWRFGRNDDAALSSSYYLFTAADIFSLVIF